jgi:hypothetical protein
MVSTLINSKVLKFVSSCLIDPDGWRFSSTPGGAETLYASSFACMLYHYLGLLKELPPRQKEKWVAYLNSWQDPTTGLFLGPELVSGERVSTKHSFEHLAQHLTAHVLPALILLGSRPKYPLAFAYPYLDPNYLVHWLDARDWRDAWLEGNNLLFIGQFLVFLRDFEKYATAQPALELYFDWLDKEQDPATGLWGSNGFCSKADALYGGYHQLLIYYYVGRPIRYGERLIDVALELQHSDGGFNPNGGGGACEDTDAIDILINMYKRLNYKRPQVRIALRKAVKHILDRQMPDGGFVYRLHKPFIHMGMKSTSSPPDKSNLFPTWFRVHTLALISEVLTDELEIQFDWGFNDSCSMGWHHSWDKSLHQLTYSDRLQEKSILLVKKVKQFVKSPVTNSRALISRLR